MDELEFLRNKDIHEGHDKAWLQKPSLEKPEEITQETTVQDSSTFEDDVKQVRNVLSNLNSVLFERQDAIKMLVLALLAREHGIFYGHPGTGKNFMVDRFSQCVDHTFFEYQIAQDTTADDLFGPMDIAHLRSENEMRRDVRGTLLEAEIGFLDEIGNSNSMIRNVLKGLMQERKYPYGRSRVNAPLQTVIAASNAVLQYEDDPTEHAFEDRFLFRHKVEYLEAKESKLAMLKLRGRNLQLPVIEHAVITRLQSYVNEVEMSDDFYLSVIDFVEQMTSEAPGGILPMSDRRLRKVISAIAANAVLNGRKKAKRADLSVLGFISWNDPDSQMVPVQDWIKAHLVNNLDKIEAIVQSLDSIWSGYEQAKDNPGEWADRMGNAMLNRKMIEKQQQNMQGLIHSIEDNDEREAIDDFFAKSKTMLDQITIDTLELSGSMGDDSTDDDLESLKK
jgi:MoxR-like ATPase